MKEIKEIKFDKKRDFEKLSPMMKHYVLQKEEYPDCILFYRLGDFYEMFFEDAVRVSRELELTLTGKNCGLSERAPMCGVPYHSADTYIARLVDKGYKVAICEQVEDPKSAKGIVKREVTNVITPGTVISDTMLSEANNNYLASVYMEGIEIGISYCDISTGELYSSTCEASVSMDEISDELSSIEPKEILINQHFADKFGLENLSKNITEYINLKNDNYVSNTSSLEIIEGELGKGTISSCGITGRTAEIKSLAILLSFLRETQKITLSQINKLEHYDISGKMSLDRSTIINLEILETLYDKRKSGSLLGVLDKTKTAMGARMLRRIIKHPLKDAQEISNRLNLVNSFVSDILLLNNIRALLTSVYDFERISGKLASGTINPNDMLALKRTLSVLPDIKAELESISLNGYANKIVGQIDTMPEVFSLIDEAISEDAGFSIKDGGIIKEGYSKDLDELQNSINDAKEWIASLENKERERTGIKTLKVGFNKVFGYYITVSRSSSDNVPEEYIRKQTLVNNERYITPELKSMESLVLNAEEKINKLNYDIFCELREKIKPKIPNLQKTAISVALIDVLSSFALVSKDNSYVMPEMTNGDEIVIAAGRHPVVEQTEKAGTFVSNDLYMNLSDSSMMIITGPNMAGKSTFMRQVAIIVLMAQIGCFVPCDMARIGVVDRIFTRIGASDNLSRGQSTFYVEMSELSYILNSSTSKSLIILDEIGRGTSTFDGLAIALATVRYLTTPEHKAKTLFATHYHELTSLEEEIPGVKNLNVDVEDNGTDVVFLHKIVEGPANKSYGIHVAKLAGVPRSIITDAQSILKSLETDAEDNNAVKVFRNELQNQNEDSGDEESSQISFLSLLDNDIFERIKSIDLMDMRPSEALSLLEELKNKLS